MKVRLSQEHALSKRVGFVPKHFKNTSRVYIQDGKKLYIDYIEVTNIGRGKFKEFLEAVHNEGFKIYIPKAPVYLKKIIRSYRLPFDIWVDEDEKLCLDNYAVIHPDMLMIKPRENYNLL